MSAWKTVFADAKEEQEIKVAEKRCPLCSAEFERFFTLCPYDQTQLQDLPMPDELLNERFKFERKMGQGSLTDVYEGTDTQGDTGVVIKVLRNNLDCSPFAWKRLNQELMVAAALNHPNVAKVHAFGALSGAYALKPYVVMERLDGVSLAAALKQCGQCPSEQGLGLAREIIAAIENAHALGVIHGDIKPANVFLSKADDSLVKALVVDFALSYHYFQQNTGSTKHGGMPQVFVAPTSIAYVAPENSTGTPATQKSDVFSLGCLLYELMAGAPPFKAESLFELAYEHRETEPKPPKTEGFTQPMIDAVMLCLEKQPDKRTIAISELKKAFD